MTSEREHLGALIKNMDCLNDLEYKVVFNLPENIFFQKLVPKEILEKVRVRPEDYLKALLFLDYFSRIILDNYTACNNLENLSRAIRDKEREKEQKEGLPDKWDRGSSYLSLDVVVLESGLCFQERQISEKRKTIDKQKIKRRYAKEKRFDPTARKLDPFYEGIGEMVYSKASDRMKKYFGSVSSRAEIGAVIFADSVLACLKDSRVEAEVCKRFDAGDYLEASMIALEHLAKGASLAKLSPLIKIT